MSDVTNISVRAGDVVPVDTLGGQVTVKVNSGGPVYYADNAQVSSANNQGSITAGNSVTFSAPQFITGAAGVQASVTLTLFAGSSTAPGAPKDVVLGSDGLLGGPGGTGLTGTVLTVSSPTTNETVLWNGSGWVSTGTQSAGDNSVKPATTAYADAAVGVETTRATAAEALKAPLASPTFTGHPVGVTETALNSSTRLASTAYADAAVAVETSRAGAAEALLAPIASPTFTGTTTAPEFSASGLTGATSASRYVGATASGAPVSGTFAIGDFVVDQSGALWVCTIAGTPGTWVSNQPGIELGYAQVTSNVAVTGSLVDVAGLSVTVTVGSRPIAVVFGCESMQISTAGNFGGVYIRESSTTLFEAQYGVGAVNECYPVVARVRLAPSAGSHTYKISVQGVGTIAANDRMLAATTSPAFIQAVQL